MAEQQPGESTKAYMCRQEPQLSTVYFTYLTPTICALSALTVCICMAFYIGAYRNKQLKVIRYLFASTTLFFLVTLFNYLSWMIMTMTACSASNYAIYHPLVAISTTLILLRTMLLVAIFFKTTHTAFNGTPFALSKCTVISFYILFVVSCALTLFGALMFVLDLTMSAMYLLGFAQTVLDVVSIYLLCVFIHKLVQTYRGAGSGDDQQLVAIITKIALLFSIAACTRIAVTLSQIGLSMVTPSVHYVLFCELTILLDLGTNFLCILLCSKYFHPMYLKLCGLGDKCCRRCWTRCVAPTVDEQMMAKELEIKRVQTVSTVLPSSASGETHEFSYDDAKGDNVSVSGKPTLANIATISASRSGQESNVQLQSQSNSS